MTVILLQLNKRTMKIYCLPCHVYNISSQHITEVKWQWEENCFEHLVFNYHSLLKLPSNCLSTNKCAASVQVIWTSNISFCRLYNLEWETISNWFWHKKWVCFFCERSFQIKSSNNFVRFSFSCCAISTSVCTVLTWSFNFLISPILLSI